MCTRRCPSRSKLLVHCAQRNGRAVAGRARPSPRRPVFAFFTGAGAAAGDADGDADEDTEVSTVVRAGISATDERSN